jgi:hypothetical protein
VLALGTVVAIRQRRAKSSRKLSPIAHNHMQARLDSYVLTSPVGLRRSVSGVFVGGTTSNFYPASTVESPPTWTDRLPVRNPGRPIVIEDLPKGGRRIKVLGGTTVTFSGPVPSRGAVGELSSRCSQSEQSWCEDEVVHDTMV